MAPSPYSTEPVPLDLDLEALQTLHIAWHAVIIVMPLDHLPKPRSEVGHRVMTPTHQGAFNDLKLLAHPFFARPSFDGEPLIPVALATDMHEPQEFKSLWLPLSSLPPVLSRKTTELDQPSLDGV